MSDPSDAGIDVLLRERRTFPPSRAFTDQAIISAPAVYDEAEADVAGLWLRRAISALTWDTPPTRSLEWDPPHCTWFADGTLTVAGCSAAWTT